jgi:hypothetical protein
MSKDLAKEIEAAVQSAIETSQEIKEMLNDPNAGFGKADEAFTVNLAFSPEDRKAALMDIVFSRLFTERYHLKPNESDEETIDYCWKIAAMAVERRPKD